MVKKYHLLLFAWVVGLGGCDLYPKIMGNAVVANDLYGTNQSAQYGTSALDEYGVNSGTELYGKSENIQYADKDDYSGSRTEKIDIEKPKIPVQKITTIVAKDTFSQENYGTISLNKAVSQYQTYEPDDVLLVSKKVAAIPQKPIIVRSESGEIIVQKSDTLFSISQKYNVPLRDLLDENKLRPPYSISVGQKLKLPVSRYHTVNIGETLYSISRGYSVDLNSLVKENNLTAPYGLVFGQRLRLPAKIITPQLPVPVMVQPIPSVTTKTIIVAANIPKTPAVIVATKAPVIAPVTAVPTQTVKTPIVTDKTKISSTTPSGKVVKLPRIMQRESNKFSWPVTGKIISNFGAKNNGLYNDGINIAAAQGTIIKSAENGVVAYAGNELKGMGNLIIVQHSGGWMTVYAHMDAMSVRRGDKIALGQKVGTVGRTGKVSVSQLHFEIRKGTKAYNPTSQLKK